MATSATFNNITYHGNDGDIGEAIVKRLIQGLALERLGFVVRTDITVREEMLFVALQDKLTRPGTGCGVSANNGNVSVSSKWLEPRDCEIEDVYCAKDWDKKVKGVALKVGVNLKDMTDTDIGKLLVELYADVWKRDSKNLALNGDTAQAGGSQANAAFYATMDGIWKYLMSGVASAAGDGAQVQRFTVAATTSTALPADYTANVFLPGLYAKQSNRMRAMDDENPEGNDGEASRVSEKLYVVSDELWENYYQTLANNKVLESSWRVLQDGSKTLSYRGIPVVREHLFDEGAADKGETTIRRGWLVVQGNLEAGFDTDTEGAVMEFFYDKKSKSNTMRINWQECVNYAQGDMIVVGY
ncbi:MAG: hypothetical protein ACRYFX_09915 [Janthinobacterium lividum]